MEIILRLVGFLQTMVYWVTAPIYFLVRLRKHKTLPQIKHPILLLSATELARKIRTQELTSEQVIRSFIARCKEVNPSLNAIVEDRFNQALIEAHSIDQMIIKGDKSIIDIEKETPFLGVPITVKESIGVKGMSHCVGVLERKGVTASIDGATVVQVQKAGAIPIAITTTPELCVFWETNNLVTGRTLNPYDAHRTPGGSSGGEAAILGAGASVIGLGSDIVGSIRIPSAFSGIFGHKPTPGYISNEGHYPYIKGESLRKLLTIGPMARYAEDLRPLLKIMVAENAAILNLDEKVDLKNLRIFYNTGINTLSMTPTDPEIKKAVEAAAVHFKMIHGCSIDMPIIEEISDLIEITSTFFHRKDFPTELTLSCSNDGQIKKTLLGETFKYIFGKPETSFGILFFNLLYSSKSFISKSRNPIYEAMLNSLKSKFKEMLGNNGVFILPTFPTTAFYHFQASMKTFGVSYAGLFNVLELPATHVPMGLSSQRVPIGVQVVAAPNQDRLCLAVAEELGKAFGGWIPPS